MTAKRALRPRDGVRGPLLVGGAILTWLFWQLVLLGQKPAWFIFNVPYPRLVGWLLFAVPPAIAFFCGRAAGSKGWLQGGLTLSVGYLLTVPYNIIAENAKIPGGFVRYWGGSTLTAAGGVVTFFAVFFGLGAGIGYAASRAGRRGVPEPEPEKYREIVVQPQAAQQAPEGEKPTA